jgi:hypothetical protein
VLVRFLAEGEPLGCFPAEVFVGDDGLKRTRGKSADKMAGARPTTCRVYRKPMLDPSPMPSEDRRRAIFAALVDAQDKSRSLHEAKQQVLAQFGVTRAIVERIEREGRDNECPPPDGPD